MSYCNELNLLYRTRKNIFYITSLTSYLECNKITFDYYKFANECKIGCKNFRKKYSCPPYSPSFNNLSSNYNYLLVNTLKIKLDGFNKIYNTIRMANIVAKNIQKRLFNKINKEIKDRKEKIIILENGSCRLCKTCELQKKLPCRYPKKMRYSLESTGIDVNDLIKKTFNFELKWYSNNNFPEYQCVVGGILLKQTNPFIVPLI